LQVGGKPTIAKPVVTKTTEGNQTKFSITARDEKELKEIIKGIAKKHPHFDIEEAMKHAQWKRGYLQEPIYVNAEVGGVDVFRAVCKCATNYFVYSGGDITQIKHLINFITGKEDGNMVWMHYQEDLYTLNPDESFHLIHLVGNPKDNILYCYVDYFNTYKYLVLLNENYKGQELKETYCFDLINVKSIEKEVRIEYDRDTLLNFFTNKDAKPFERVKTSFDHTLTIALKRQDEFQRNQLIERAIQNSLGKYPEGTPITEEMLEEAIREVAETIAPYILREPKL
jgi:hypothetical protein